MGLRHARLSTCETPTGGAMSGPSGAKAATSKPAAAHAPRPNVRTNPKPLDPQSPRNGMPESVTCPSSKTTAPGAHEGHIRDPVTPPRSPKGSPTRSPKGAAQPKGSPKGSPNNSTGAAQPRELPKGSPKRSPQANVVSTFKCSACHALMAWEDVGCQQGEHITNANPASVMSHLWPEG